MGWPGTQSIVTTKRLFMSWRLAFEFEQHLPLEHVAEGGPAGMSVWRGAGTARRVFDDDGHGMCAFGNGRRLRLLHNRQRVLPFGVVGLRHLFVPPLRSALVGDVGQCDTQPLPASGC